MSFFMTFSLAWFRPSLFCPPAPSRGSTAAHRLK
jgi:hypothetical protein